MNAVKTYMELPKKVKSYRHHITIKRVQIHVRVTIVVALCDVGL